MTKEHIELIIKNNRLDKIKMKILILGGTGLVGKTLVSHFSIDNEVKAFGREIYNQEKTLEQSIEWSDLLIQLSGATIAKRWTKKYKEEIWTSRINTNKKLAKIYNNSNKSPKVIFASAVGFYPESDCENPFDETYTQHGPDFLSVLAKNWEEEAFNISEKALVYRFGVILSKDGGALKEMLPMYRLGAGGPIGDGTQCFPWIHIQDIVKAFQFGIDQNLSGIYNLTSPNLINQKEFGKALASAINRPFIIKTFPWQLKLLFGEGSQVLMKSLSVKPQKLIDIGFKFDFPNLNDALNNLFK